MWPALFITDVTADPTSTAGDWQFGGKGIPPHDVFGTWKSAVRTVNSGGAVTITPDVDPAENPNWNLGAGSDAPPVGTPNDKFGTEVRWSIDRLIASGDLIPGHKYRFQFMVHDGDQNKTGGDVGEGCTTTINKDTVPMCPVDACDAAADTTLQFKDKEVGVEGHQQRRHAAGDQTDHHHLADGQRPAGRGAARRQTSSTAATSTHPAQ